MAYDILIVDDEPDIRLLIEGILRDEGYETRGAGDADAAIAAFRVRRPSLVILDVHMPCLDGWGVLQELSRFESTRAIPVVVVTSSDVIQATAQAVAILTKPISPEELLPVIRQQLSF